MQRLKKKKVSNGLKNIIFILFLALFLSSCSKQENNTIEKSNLNENAMILYYGDSCPHCKIVEQYINENGIIKKYDIVQKEVFQDQNNAKDLGEKALGCGIKTDIGVPFLYYKSQCFMGDQDIINFFKKDVK